MLQRVPTGWPRITVWPRIAVTLTLGAFLALVSFPNRLTPQATTTTPCRPAATLPDPQAPTLDCAAPPNTFDVSGFFASDATAEAKAAAGPTWDSWAWASFAAMNWPVKTAASQPTGFERGVPDTAKSFKGAQSTDVLVWETLKEKRELFQPTSTTTGKVMQNSLWQDVTFDPAQQPPQLEPCPGTSPREEHHRLLSQGGKVPTNNSGDETIEVASPALEPNAELCSGFPANPPIGGIGKQQCEGLFPDVGKRTRPPVGPRVWKGDPGAPGSRPLYFEVKVNYDFWSYILEQQFYDDSVARPAAASPSRAAHPKLPFRTSASKGPGRSPNAVFDYDAGAVATSYRGLADPESLPGIGSVQLKAAWLRLTAAEDPRQFHVTEAVYYKTIDPNAPPGLDNTCYAVDQFGLLGLHIIQRVHSSSFNRTTPDEFAPGGTFVFATWEHTSLEAAQPGYYYANYLTANQPGFNVLDFQTTPFPNFPAGPGNAIVVERMKAYPLETTAAVNNAAHAQLPAGSVWRNYRLIGTQFLAVDSEGASSAFNQPYYLANLVVETNQGLQHFQGLPPKVTVTPYYTDKVGIQGTTNHFEPDFPNVIFNRELNKPLNMGGCMGCHGVAQLKGYNFSFVFADGQAGSDLDTQRHFEVAGALP